MFEYSKKIMNKIINKEELAPNELGHIERCLRLSECDDMMLDYILGFDFGENEPNIFELTNYFKNKKG